MRDMTACPHVNSAHRYRWVCVLALCAAACGRAADGPTAPSALPPSSAVPVSPATPVNGIAASVTEAEPFGVLAVHQSGEMLGVMTRAAGSAQVAGAAFVLADGSSAVVYAGDDGLPARAVVGDVAVSYSNYTSATVDVSVRTPTGTVSTQRGVAVDAGMLAQLKVPSSGAVVARRRLIGTTAVSDAQLGILLKTSSALLSVAGCGLSVSSLGVTAGLSAVIVASTCAGAFVKAAALINPTLDTPLLSASGALMSATTCFGLHSPTGCLALVLATAQNAQRLADAILALRPAPAVPPVSSPTPAAPPPSAPTLGGTIIRSGVAVTDLSGAAGSERVFTINVPIELNGPRRSLDVVLSGGSGNADLYLDFGLVLDLPAYAFPITGRWQCQSMSLANDERCALSDARGGWWYVFIRAKTAYAGVTLRATVSSDAR